MKIRLPKGQIGQGTSTERFFVRNQCRRWPRRPCGQLGVFIFSDDVGKTLFPGGVFQRGVSEGCFRPLGGSPERFCVMYLGGNFVKIPPPEGQIRPGTSTERSPFENQCRRWPRRPCGQLGVFIFSDDVGKTLFPVGVLRRGFQRGVRPCKARPGASA